MAEATNLRFVLAPAVRPYQRQWLRADILAGLAGGAVVIPQAMAYATVADMPLGRVLIAARDTGCSAQAGGVRSSGPAAETSPLTCRSFLAAE
jgi:MFS superfamily sulfate permease-like transporter